MGFAIGQPVSNTELWDGMWVAKLEIRFDFHACLALGFRLGELGEKKGPSRYVGTCEIDVVCSYGGMDLATWVSSPACP